MTRAGPVRSRKAERSTPYSRPQQRQEGQPETKPAPSLFSKVRGFLFGYKHTEEPPASPRVPRVVPTQLEVTQDSIMTSTEEAAFASGYVSGMANASSSMPGAFDSSLRAGPNVATSSPYVSRHSSFAHASGQEFAAPSWVALARNEDPNETLRRFFEEKGDRELSMVEIEGVNSLIDQAAARGESMIDMDTLQPGESFFADRTETILTQGSTSRELTPQRSTPRGSTPGDSIAGESAAAAENNLWSPRRRSLAAGPKIDRAGSESPNGSFRFTARPFRHQEPPAESPKRPARTSATANALLEILDSDKAVPDDLAGLVDADTFSGFKPRRRQVGSVPPVVATSTPEPAESVPSKATQAPAPAIPAVLSAKGPVKPTLAELDAKISNLDALASAAPQPALKTATQIFCAAAKASFRIVELGPEVQEPAAHSAAYNQLMQPIRDAPEKISDLLDANQSLQVQLRALGEAARVFSWTASGTPVQYIQSIKTSAVFFAKRVLAAQPGHKLVDEVVAFLGALGPYVDANFSKGFKWTGAAPLGTVLGPEPALPASASPYNKHKPVRPSSLRRSIVQSEVEQSDSDDVVDLVSDDDEQDTTVKEDSSRPNSAKNSDSAAPKPVEKSVQPPVVSSATPATSGIPMANKSSGPTSVRKWVQSSEPSSGASSEPALVPASAPSSATASATASRPNTPAKVPATPEPLFDPGAPSHISSTESTPAPAPAPEPALPTGTFVLGAQHVPATGQKSTDTIPDFAFPAPPVAPGPAILSPAEETRFKSFEDEFIF